MAVGAIVPAAGVGRRVGSDTPKQFLMLRGKPIFLWVIRALQAVEEVGAIGLVIPRGYQEQVLQHLGLADSRIFIVAGGKRRQDSVHAGVTALRQVSHIVIHDGVRPLVRPELIRQVLASARRSRAAMSAVPLTDSLVSVDENLKPREGLLDRERYWAIQTPQAYDAGLLAEAFKAASQQEIVASDESALVRRLGYHVEIVKGDYRNLKVTTPEDLIVAEALMKQRTSLD